MIRNGSVARGVATPPNAELVYTVPASNVLLLKDVRVATGTVAGTEWSVTLYDPVSGTTVYLVFQKAFTTLADGWAGWTALNAGHQIQFAAIGNPVAYWISGAVLPYSSELT